MTITINQISSGVALNINGDIYLVSEYHHVKPGKGSAFVRVKLKNIKTDYVIEKTFKTADKLNDVQLDEKEFQFLYQSGDSFHFMDHTSYEQVSIAREDLGEDVIKFLKDNLEVTAVCRGHSVLKVILPTFINFTITETEPGFKGDSSRAGTKPAVIETGTPVQVPLFINRGDIVRIDTRSGQYVERVQR